MLYIVFFIFCQLQLLLFYHGRILTSTKKTNKPQQQSQNIDTCALTIHRFLCLTIFFFAEPFFRKDNKFYFHFFHYYIFANYLIDPQNGFLISQDFPGREEHCPDWCPKSGWSWICWKNSWFSSSALVTIF